MKFSTETVTQGRSSAAHQFLEKLKDYTIKAWDESYTPKKGTEEAEAIDTIREAPDAMAVVEETDSPATAYSRAAALRVSKSLPSGTWQFAGKKTEGDDETEHGIVLARYVSEADPELVEEGGDEEE